MAVPKEVLEKAREMLEHAKRPIFLHDDDCDGTTSFVICYQFCRANGEGKGISIKRSPSVGHEFVRHIQEFNADLVVILDKPKADAAFFEEVKLPVLWIDHHEPQTDIVEQFQNVLYLNPRVWDDADNLPTSYWSYKITKTNLWMATVGCVSDWHIPDYIAEFKEQYPDLVPKPYAKVEDLYLDTPIATLIRVIQFNIKGQSMDARKSILTLTRIESPYEILKQTTSRGRFLWKKYERLERDYERMLEEAKESAKQEGPVLLHIYQDNSMTFTSELSNELLIRYPGRVVLIGRHHEGVYKCSARSKDIELPPIIAESLKGLDGYGGGHPHACGLSVKENDWDEFYRRFTALVGK